MVKRKTIIKAKDLRLHKPKEIHECLPTAWRSSSNFENISKPDLSRSKYLYTEIFIFSAGRSGIENTG